MKSFDIKDISERERGSERRRGIREAKLSIAVDAKGDNVLILEKRGKAQKCNISYFQNTFKANQRLRLRNYGKAAWTKKRITIICMPWLKNTPR